MLNGFLMSLSLLLVLFFLCMPEKSTTKQEIGNQPRTDYNEWINMDQCCLSASFFFSSLVCGSWTPSSSNLQRVKSTHCTFDPLSPCRSSFRCCLGVASGSVQLGWGMSRVPVLRGVWLWGLKLWLSQVTFLFSWSLPMDWKASIFPCLGLKLQRNVNKHRVTYYLNIFWWYIKK